MAASTRSYWLTNPCRLRRRDQSLVVERDNQPPVHIPITDIRDLVAAAPVDVNTAVVSLLSHHGIDLHLLDYYGNYAGTVAGASKHCSGTVVLRQAQLAGEPAAAISLARAFVLAAAHNLNVVLNRPDELADPLKKLRATAKGTDNPAELMGAEGHFRRHIWTLVDQRLPDWLRLGGRRRRPPPNPGNAFISYVNGITYSQVLTAIRTTPLHSGLGFLHATTTRRRHTLALDLAEPFKPLVTLRLLLRLAGRRQLQPAMFDAATEGTSFSEEGRRTIITHTRDLLETTTQNPAVGRPTSTWEMMRLDALRLTRHLLEAEEFIPTRAWW